MRTKFRCTSTEAQAMSGASILMLIGAIISVGMSLDFLRPLHQTNPF